MLFPCWATWNPNKAGWRWEGQAHSKGAQWWMDRSQDSLWLPDMHRGVSWGCMAAVCIFELHTEFQCPRGHVCQAGAGLLTEPWGLTLADFTHHPVSGSRWTSLRGLPGKPGSSFHPPSHHSRQQRIPHLLTEKGKIPTDAIRLWQNCPNCTKPMPYMCIPHISLFWGPPSVHFSSAPTPIHCPTLSQMPQGL